MTILQAMVVDVRPTTCEYSGTTYESGDTWKDGCTDCSCINGFIRCYTMMSLCLPPPCVEEDRIDNSDECNSCPVCRDGGKLSTLTPCICLALSQLLFATNNAQKARIVRQDMTCVISKRGTLGECNRDKKHCCFHWELNSGLNLGLKQR